MPRNAEQEKNFDKANRASREFLGSWPNKLNEIAGTPIAVWMRLAQARHPHKSLEQHALELVSTCLFEDSVASFTELVHNAIKDGEAEEADVEQEPQAEQEDSK